MINLQRSSQFRDGANSTKTYWSTCWKMQVQKGKKQENSSYSFSKLCVSTTASLHRICAFLQLYFPKFPFAEVSFPSSPPPMIWMVRVRRLLTVKYFPSNKHLLLTSHVGESQALNFVVVFLSHIKISTLGLAVFWAPLTSSSSVADGGCWEWNTPLLLEPCVLPEGTWARLFLQCHLASQILTIRRLSLKPEVILGALYKCNMQYWFSVTCLYFTMHDIF